MDIDNPYPRKIWCEACKAITDHLIVLHSASDERVIFFKSCDICYGKYLEQTRNDMFFWEIEKTTIKDWNALILTKLY